MLSKAKLTVGLRGRRRPAEPVRRRGGYGDIGGTERRQPDRQVFLQRLLGPGRPDHPHWLCAKLVLRALVRHAAGHTGNHALAGCPRNRPVRLDCVDTVTQPLLIAGRNITLHRRLGWTAGAIATLAVVLGNVASVAAMHVGFIGLGDPAAFSAIPFFDIQTFAIFVALAFWFRKRADLHKRLILLSSTQLMEAAISRVPLAIIQDHAPWGSFVAGDWIILVGIAYDLWSRGRVHPVWIWGGGFVVLSEIVRLLIWHTEPWLASRTPWLPSGREPPGSDPRAWSPRRGNNSRSSAPLRHLRTRRLKQVRNSASEYCRPRVPRRINIEKQAVVSGPEPSSLISIS